MHALVLSGELSVAAEALAGLIEPLRILVT